MVSETPCTTTESDVTITATVTVVEDIYVDCLVSKGKTHCTTVSTSYSTEDPNFMNGYNQWDTSVEGGYYPYSRTYSIEAKPTSRPYGYGYRYGKL